MNLDIFFNEKDLDEEIKNSENNIYKKEEDIYFSFVDNSIKTDKKEKYFVNIMGNKEQYVGVLTENYKREYLGYNLFEQGDEYLGELSDEKKNGFGIYNFKLNKEDEENIFFGNFKDNQIDGFGIYLYIYKKEEEKDPKKKKWNKFKLIKYNCCIGLFEKGKFQKGKIYIFDNNYEKLYPKNIDENDNTLVIEKKGDAILLIDKYIMEKNTIIEGNVISFNKNSKDKIENQFSFKAKENTYIFCDLKDEIKSEIQKEYNKINLDKFSGSIQSLISEYNNMRDRFKNIKYIPYCRILTKDKFKEPYLKYLQPIQK